MALSWLRGGARGAGDLKGGPAWLLTQCLNTERCIFEPRLSVGRNGGEEG
jgi:hypothetical protein